MTPSQTAAYTNIKSDLTDNKQVLCFVTGEGGTGKSFLIEAISKLALFNKKNIAVCATSASAAGKVKGSTVHSLFQMNPNLDSVSSVGPMPTTDLPPSIYWLSTRFP